MKNNINTNTLLQILTLTRSIICSLNLHKQKFNEEWVTKAIEDLEYIFSKTLNLLYANYGC